MFQKFIISAMKCYGVRHRGRNHLRFGREFGYEIKLISPVLKHQEHFQWMGRGMRRGWMPKEKGKGVEGGRKTNSFKENLIISRKQIVCQIICTFSKWRYNSKLSNENVVQLRDSTRKFLIGFTEFFHEAVEAFHRKQFAKIPWESNSSTMTRSWSRQSKF